MRLADEWASRLSSRGMSEPKRSSTAVIWDNHACMPLRTDAAFLTQLERYRQAGINVVSLNVGFGEMSWADHVRILSFMRQWLSQRPDQYALPARVEDVIQCKAERKLGVVFDIEGMHPVIEELSLIQTFYELGVRWMLIAYNRNNAAGGGCLDVDTGLTDHGRAILTEMQRVGMTVCLSHTGARTAADAIEYCSQPTIFSHSNPYADTPHPRNISNQLMSACARKGGVVGLSGFGPYLGGSGSVVDRLLRQLRHVIGLVGAEHVALGLDYVFDVAELDEYIRADPSLFPSDIRHGTKLDMVPPEAIMTIANTLARENLTDDHIQGILGGNWLRVAKIVWR